MEDILLNVSVRCRTAEGLGRKAQAQGAPKSLAGAPPAPKVVEKLVTRLTPEQTVFRDKLGFVAGISNIGVTAFWMAKSPQTFYWCRTCPAIIRWRSLSLRRVAMHRWFGYQQDQPRSALWLNVFISEERHSPDRLLGFAPFGFPTQIFLQNLPDFQPQ